MMDATVRQDAISVEIFANLFKAVVDEMAWIVLRSSHTTFVKETQDFAVSLVTNITRGGDPDALRSIAVRSARYDSEMSDLGRR